MAYVNLKSLAQEMGMTFDQKRMAVYGYYQGYHMVIRHVPNQRLFSLCSI
ncbi:hypothetical protein [Caproiciproducens sp. LBM24188]|nr:hypothetical protein [Clostridiales bacterium]